MSVPTVDAAINDLLDRGWHAVYELLSARGLLGTELVVEEYTDDPTSFFSLDPRK